MQRREEDLDSLKKAFTDSILDLRLEMTAYRNDLQSEVAACNKLIGQVDTSISTKIAALEDENNLLHKRLNRGDIVISGLPSGLGDLEAVAIKLCSVYGVDVSRSDINHACYMYNSKALLIKFNSVCLRDKVMKDYFKTRTLKLCDVVDCDIDRRVYLNDHFSPAAGKLNSICRRLLRLKKIVKFKILNTANLKAKLTLSCGDEVIYGIKECADLLNSVIAGGPA